jgi:hypothetical protein
LRLLLLLGAAWLGPTPQLLLLLPVALLVGEQQQQQ